MLISADISINSFLRRLSLALPTCINTFYIDLSCHSFDILKKFDNVYAYAKLYLGQFLPGVNDEGLNI